MKMKRIILTFFSINLLLLCVCAINAQQNNFAEQNSTQQATPEDIANADVLILANVRARELKFETVPNTRVDFPGTQTRRTFWEADRQNLPRPVEPGVTYRNIGIQLRIVSRFADIERIVAEALGEIPASDDAQPVQPNAASPQNPLAQNKTVRETKQLKTPR
jgi:hypothetical protein